MTEAAEPGSKPSLDPMQTAELVIVTNAWATPMQVGRAKSMISSAEPTSTAGLKLGKILFEHRILTHEQMHQLEQILRQQEHLEGYQLLKKLGSGGMGTVYLAKHLSSNQEVALKVVNNRLADDADFINRFQRETKALSILRHKHLANIIDAGAAGSTHYMAMEYVNGPSLGSLLKEFKALPETYVLYIVRQVAECLAYVNAQSGLVHRDIKPDNILINRTNATGEMFPEDDDAKLIDFGLVKTSADDEHLTQTGMTIGTPLYMSPEQVRGEKLDGRSDIYGLGATMYNLLTGQPPYRASSPGAIMSAHLTEPVPDPGDLVPSLNTRTRKLVMMSIAKSPDNRFLTFDAMIKACDEALDNIKEKAGGGTMKLLRKPLVITKSPQPKKSGEKTTSRVLTDPGPEDHSDEAVSSRIRQKHMTAKHSSSDMYPAPGKPMKAQVNKPAAEVEEDIFADAPGSGSSGNRMRPATEALMEIQSAAIKARTQRVVKDAIAESSSSRPATGVKTSAVFDDEEAQITRKSWIPLAVIGLIAICALIYGLFR